MKCLLLAILLILAAIWTGEEPGKYLITIICALTFIGILFEKN